MILGSTDHEIRVFSIAGDDDDDNDSAEGASPSHTCLRPMGSVKRQAGGNERVSRLRFNEAGTLLACLGTGKSMDLFR